MGRNGIHGYRLVKEDGCHGCKLPSRASADIEVVSLDVHYLGRGQCRFGGWWCNEWWVCHGSSGFVTNLVVAVAVNSRALAE